MLSETINSIEKLALSPFVRSGEIYKATEEILIESSNFLNCERVNAWTLDATGTQLDSLKSYIKSENKFKLEESLKSEDIPIYFSNLMKNEAIVSDNAELAEINSELLDIYIRPLNINSMIDVPIRSQGEIVGLICFEHTKKVHHWTIEEQKFTQSIAQLLSLALESFEKQKYQKELESIIHEKEVLISEINHRVKNNMAVIISLLKLQNQKCKDEFHIGLIKDVTNRVYSMASIQEKLHTSQNFSEIDLKTYLEDLVENLSETYNSKNRVNIELQLSQILLDITKAVPIGLIANEVLTNSFKHAFENDNKNPKLKISLTKKEENVKLEIADNGPGINTQASNLGMGLELIKDLAEQINANLTLSSNKGATTTLLF